MAVDYDRAEFLARLRAAIAGGKPLLMTAAGSGIVAKFVERGGIDIIGVYNTGYFRMQGYGSLAGMLPIADANEMVFRMGEREILPQVQTTPVIAGLNGVDVTRDMRRFLVQIKAIGYSGIHNFPTVGWFDGSFRDTLESTGLGFQMEVDMLKWAKELDMLTIGYAFSDEETRQVVGEAAVDVFIYHAGITRGGTTGYAKGASLEDMANRSQHHYDIARSMNPDVILLAHGAALVTPEDARYLVENTDAQGVQLGSSIERLAMEQPLQERTALFKSKMAAAHNASQKA